MTEKEFYEIMTDDESDELDLSEHGCRALKGLKIIEKYLPNSGVSAAEHDIIYACEITELVEAGITIEDTVELRRQNWMADSEFGCMAKYV